MLPVLRFAIAILMSTSLVERAWSCSAKYEDTLFPLDSSWRAKFGKEFDLATGVYLVTVSSAGALEEPARASCDGPAHSPPPPPPHPSIIERGAYAAATRAAEQAKTVCQAEKADIHVIETIKGPPLDGWLETTALIEVAHGQPNEPVSWYDETPAYGARVTSFVQWRCEHSAWVRRMNVGTPYLVFTRIVILEEPAYMTYAFLAAPGTPFLSEARRLQSSPK